MPRAWAPRRAFRCRPRRSWRACSGAPASSRGRAGSGGGIKLARPAAAITLADIVEAVDGPIALTACLDAAGADCCALDNPCAIRPHWIGVNRLVRDALAQVTLAQLIAAPDALLAGAIAAPAHAPATPSVEAVQ